MPFLISSLIFLEIKYPQETLFMRWPDKIWYHKWSPKLFYWNAYIKYDKEMHIW